MQKILSTQRLRRPASSVAAASSVYDSKAHRSQRWTDTNRLAIILVVERYAPFSRAAFVSDWLCAASPWPAPAIKQQRLPGLPFGQNPLPHQRCRQRDLVVRRRGEIRASVHRTNTCASCHSDITSSIPTTMSPVQTRLRRMPPKQPRAIARVFMAWRWQGAAADSATCSDCHDGHTVLPPTSPESPLHFSNLAQTCGACHDQAAEMSLKACMAKQSPPAIATRRPAPIAIPSTKSSALKSSSPH